MSGPYHRLGPEWDEFFRRTEKKGLLPWPTVAEIWNRRSGENLSHIQANAIACRAARKIRAAIKRDPLLRATAISQGLTV